MWNCAFYFGPESGFWVLGKAGIFFIGFALLLRGVEFLIPGKRPKTRTVQGSGRKCRICGKPATAGSEFCSYHSRYGAEDNRY